MNGPSPTIIRAWFDTVLNPLIEGLEIEKSFLEEKNLTWSGFGAYFKSLKPFFNFINQKFYPNLEQIENFYPMISESKDNYDKALDDLSNSCADLYLKLIHSEEIESIYNDAVKNYLETHKSISENISFNENSQANRNYIAEYIINNKSNLDSGYILSPIWNPNKDMFKNILQSNNFNTLLKNQETALNKFSIELSTAISKLKDLRNELSLKYGEPIIVAY